MIKPDSKDYYAVTDVVHVGTLSWRWEATLCQPWPWRPYELDRDYGHAATEKRARRKADRAARRMLRAAASWIHTTYQADGRSEEEVREHPSDIEDADCDDDRGESPYGWSDLPPTNPTTAPTTKENH